MDSWLAYLIGDEPLQIARREPCQQNRCAASVLSGTRQQLVECSLGNKHTASKSNYRKLAVPRVIVRSRSADPRIEAACSTVIVTRDSSPAGELEPSSASLIACGFAADIR